MIEREKEKRSKWRTSDNMLSIRVYDSRDDETSNDNGVGDGRDGDVESCADAYNECDVDSMRCRANEEE